MLERKRRRVAEREEARKKQEPESHPVKPLPKALDLTLPLTGWLASIRKPKPKPAPLPPPPPAPVKLGVDVPFVRPDDWTAEQEIAFLKHNFPEVFVAFENYLNEYDGDTAGGRGREPLGGNGLCEGDRDTDTPYSDQSSRGTSPTGNS